MILILPRKERQHTVDYESFTCFIQHISNQAQISIDTLDCDGDLRIGLRTPLNLIGSLKYKI